MAIAVSLVMDSRGFWVRIAARKHWHRNWQTVVFPCRGLPNEYRSTGPPSVFHRGIGFVTLGPSPYQFVNDALFATDPAESNVVVLVIYDLSD